VKRDITQGKQLENDLLGRENFLLAK